jgi:mRNA-degrading endonuclease RelE of RelBE toxin-antitoxin system
MAYRIEYDPAAEDHIAALSAHDQSMVLDRVPQQLSHQPMAITANRKRMRPNPLAPWELRVAHLRVYYDVEVEPERVVTVRAVGIKEGSRVRIGGKVIEL